MRKPKLKDVKLLSWDLVKALEGLFVKTENIKLYLHLAVQHRASYLTFLIFIFLINKREVKISLSHGFCEMKWSNTIMDTYWSLVPKDPNLLAPNALVLSDHAWGSG